MADSNTDEKPKKPSKKSEDIVKMARDCIEQSYDHDKVNREEAACDLNFLAGNQWPDEAVTWLGRCPYARAKARLKPSTES